MLFDDETQDLVLDFCLWEGKPWKRMTSDQARQRKKKRPADSRMVVDEEELDEILDGETTVVDDDLNTE